MGNSSSQQKRTIQVGAFEKLPLPQTTYPLSKIIHSADRLVIQRADFVHASRIDFRSQYVPNVDSMHVEGNDQAQVYSKKGVKDIKRLIISYPYTTHLVYHEIRKLLDHPYIMKSFEYYPVGDNTHVVLENYEGGDLFDYFTQRKRLKELQVANYARQILLALNYLHQNRICLRTLSPENIVFVSKGPEKSMIKLIGFSKATFKNPRDFLSERIGVPYYTSPDVLNGQYSFECDLWSLGVIIYTLLAGYPPFWALNDEDIATKILEGKLDFDKPEWEGISNGPKDLIKQLLTSDPVLRPTAQEAVKHNWIRMYKPGISKHDVAHAYTNLRTFSPTNKVQELVWFYIVDSILTEKDKKNLPLIFEHLDIACDGRISKEELIMFYEEEIVDLIMKRVDINRSGYLEYSEFCMGALNRRATLNKELIEKTFKLLDTNEDGLIDYCDLKAVFRSNEDKIPTEKVWDELILQGDSDCDGAINLEDLTTLLEDFP